MKSKTKKACSLAAFVVVYFGLAVGAVVLPYIVFSWLYIETKDFTLSSFVGASVFLAFSISLGIVIGVTNYLRQLKKAPSQLEEIKQLWRFFKEESE